VTEEIYADIDLLVRYETGGACVNFSAYEIVGWTEWRNAGPIYSTANCDMVESPDQAQTLITGFVKWDGCSHYFFGEADNAGYIHLCGSGAISKIRAAILKIYNRCGEIMREAGVSVMDDEFPAREEVA
jgi:hypothetical protein